MINPTRAAHEPVFIMNAHRENVLAAGHVWLEVAMITAMGPVVYTNSPKTRRQAADMVRALLLLRRAKAITVVQCKCYHRGQKP